MRLLLFWSAFTITMGYTGHALHQRGIGPIHAVRRGSVYLMAVTKVTRLCWHAALGEFNRQWGLCVYQSWREW